MSCISTSVPTPLLAELIIRVDYFVDGEANSELFKDHPLGTDIPTKLAICVPTDITFADLKQRIYGHLDIDYDLQFAFNGRVYKDGDLIPDACYESFSPIGEDLDFYRPRLVMFIDLSKQLQQEGSESDGQDIPPERDVVYSDNDDLEAERNRAAHFRVVKPLFDIEMELQKIGCEAYTSQLIDAGFLQEGCFAVLSDEVLQKSGVFIPTGPKRKLLDLCQRIRAELRAQNLLEIPSPRVEEIESPQLRLKTKGLPQSVQSKLEAIKRRGIEELDIYEGPISVKKMAALGEASHRKVPGYCCTKHQHQVQQRRESNRSRNRICFSAELLAAFSWATENIDGTASLEVLLDLAIRIIRRCGWTSMQREDLMSCLYDSALMTTKDIEEAESWLIGTNSQWEERAIFAQRRYHKEKCAAAIVRCLDEVNPEFFDSYSMA